MNCCRVKPLIFIFKLVFSCVAHRSVKHLKIKLKFTISSASVPSANMASEIKEAAGDAQRDCVIVIKKIKASKTLGTFGRSFSVHGNNGLLSDS